MKHLVLCFAILFVACDSILASTPTITSFSPTSGSIGSSDTITGTNFSATPANNIVYFGGVKAAATAKHGGMREESRVVFTFIN